MIRPIRRGTENQSDFLDAFPTAISALVDLRKGSMYHTILPETVKVRKGDHGRYLEEADLDRIGRPDFHAVIVNTTSVRQRDVTYSQCVHSDKISLCDLPQRYIAVHCERDGVHELRSVRYQRKQGDAQELLWYARPV